MFYLFIIVIVGFGICVAAHADTIDSGQMRSAMRSNICPANPTPVDRPSQSDRCGGDGTHSPCGTGGNVNKVCVETYRACVKDWIEESGLINEYNAWIANCKSNIKRSNTSPNQPSKSGQSDDLQDRLKAQAKKAEEAPAKNQANETRMKQEEAVPVNQRDKELKALREEVAGKQKIQDANTAAEKV